MAGVGGVIGISKYQQLTVCVAGGCSCCCHLLLLLCCCYYSVLQHTIFFQEVPSCMQAVAAGMPSRELRVRPTDVRVVSC